MGRDPSQKNVTPGQAQKKSVFFFLVKASPAFGDAFKNTCFWEGGLLSPSSPHFCQRLPQTDIFWKRRGRGFKSQTYYYPTCCWWLPSLRIVQLPTSDTKNRPTCCIACVRFASAIAPISCPGNKLMSQVIMK